MTTSYDITDFNLTIDNYRVGGVQIKGAASPKLGGHEFVKPGGHDRVFVYTVAAPLLVKGKTGRAVYCFGKE